MIVATKAERGSKIALRREDGEGLPELVNPESGADLRRAAKKLGVTEADVAAALAQVLSPEPPKPAALTIECWTTKDGEREIYDGEPGEAPSEVLKAAMASGHEFYRWANQSQFCCLDVDLRPGFPALDGEAALRSIGPLPALWWPSRSGGLHFLFEADAPGTGFGLTADQKAGAFALVTPSLRIPSVHRLELLPNTRTDRGHARAPVARYGVADLPGALTRKGGADAVDEAKVEAWLDERGLAIGGRYSHEHCPFEPGPGSRGDPVIVHDDGLHCYRCAGVTGRGTSTWASLIASDEAGEASDPIVAAASARVHWSHARLILAAVVPSFAANEPVARAAYSALLALFDPDSLGQCMTWGAEPTAIVRSTGGWIYWPSGNTAPITVTSTRSLPWCRGRPESIETAGRAPDQPLAGYVPIRPTRCLVDAPELLNGCVVAPVTSDRDAPLPRGFVPRNVDDTLTELRLAIPSLPREFTVALKIAVLMGMRAQRAPSTPGFLLLDGPSGSGKGFCARLAAGVLGGAPGELDPTDNAELARSMGKAVSRGCAILFLDEVGKLGSMWGRSAPLLQISDRIAWRELNVGHVSAAMTAGVIFAGSTLPSGLTTMREFQRRAVRVSLPGSRTSDKWEAQFVARFGVGATDVLTTEPGRVWAESLRAWARAQPDLPWVEQGKALGAVGLEEDEEALELARVVRRLHDLWHSAPDSAFTPAGSRYVGRLKCWEGEAAALLSEWFHAETDAARDALCGRLNTAQVEDDVRCVASRAGARIYVKFSDERKRVT